MSIPPEVNAIAKAALTTFCEHHSSAAIAGQLRYTYELVGATVLLIEQRPGFMNPAAWNSVTVAKLRYSSPRGQWSLYWSDANGRWRRLSNAPPSNDIHKLLQIIADDPSSVFVR